MHSKLRTAAKLIVSLSIPLLVGVLGSLATVPAIEGWYTTLEKPALNPPAWIFAPVWTTLYVLMGLSLFVVWRSGLEIREIRYALIAFSAQLLLNLGWSFVFFGLEAPGLAFVHIAILWFTIIWTIVLFYRVSRLAAWFLVPYLLWVSFAAYLNAMIWVLN